MKLFLTEPYRWKVRDIDLRPTYRCNAKCPTCGSWKRKSPDLSYNQAMQISDNFRGLRKMIIEGGEPTLWQPLIPFINSLDVEETAVITNAIHTENIRAVCEQSTPDKMRWVISLNGIGKTHDFMRGHKGAFYKLVRSCDIMKEHGYDMRFQFVCVAENIHELQDVKDFIKAEYGREYINISYPSSAGIYGENIKCTYLDNKQMRSVLMSEEWSLSRSSLLNKIIHDIFTDKVSKKELIPCLYGRSKIHIRPDGLIQACQYDDSDAMQFGIVYDNRVVIYQHRRKDICKNIIPKCQYKTGSLCSHEAMEYSIRHNLKYLLEELWKRLT